MFWREFSAFLAKLSGMWWSHGVAAGEQTAALTTEDGLGVGTPSGFGIQRQQCGKDWACPMPGSSRMLVQDTELSPCAHLGQLSHQGEKEFAAFQSNPQIPHQKTAPSYTTGTNWIFFELFRREAKAWAAWKQNCPMNSPELPHGCSAARDSWGISKNTDFTF